MNVEKLMKMAGAVQTGGKGRVRRKKVAHKTDDKRPLKTTHVNTKPATVLNPKGTRNSSAGQRKSEPAADEYSATDDEDQDEDERSRFGCPWHDLCIKEQLESMQPHLTWEDPWPTKESLAAEGVYVDDVDDAFSRKSLNGWSRCFTKLDPVIDGPLVQPTPKPTLF